MSIYETRGKAFLPGTTISGFVVHIPDAVAPSSVSWLAIAADYGNNPYTGGHNFISNTNPGFAGIANPANANAVPEPSSFALSAIALGIFGAGYVRKRLKRSAVPA